MADKRKKDKKTTPEPGWLGSGLAAKAGKKIKDRNNRIEREMQRSTGKYRNRKKRDGS